MRATRYHLLSALSGCAWAALAYSISAEMLGPLVWFGVLASPLIGLLVGRLYRPAFKLSPTRQALASLLSFYLAVTLFGLAVGVGDAFGRDVPDRLPGGVMIQAVLASLWDVTFTGYFLWLWPVAFFNHRALRAADMTRPSLR